MGGMSRLTVGTRQLQLLKLLEERGPWHQWSNWMMGTDVTTMKKTCISLARRNLARYTRIPHPHLPEEFIYQYGITEEGREAIKSAAQAQAAPVVDSPHVGDQRDAVRRGEGVEVQSLGRRAGRKRLLGEFARHQPRRGQ